MATPRQRAMNPMRGGVLGPRLGLCNGVGEATRSFPGRGHRSERSLIVGVCRGLLVAAAAVVLAAGLVQPARPFSATWTLPRLGATQ